MHHLPLHLGLPRPLSWVAKNEENRASRWLRRGTQRPSVCRRHHSQQPALKWYVPQLPVVLAFCVVPHATVWLLYLAL